MPQFHNSYRTKKGNIYTLNYDEHTQSVEAILLLPSSVRGAFSGPVIHIEVTDTEDLNVIWERLKKKIDEDERGNKC